MYFRVCAARLQACRRADRRKRRGVRARRDASSIIVLPFDNLSGDANQGYFGDGLTNDDHHRPLEVLRAVRHRQPHRRLPTG